MNFVLQMFSLLFTEKGLMYAESRGEEIHKVKWWILIHYFIPLVFFLH